MYIAARNHRRHNPDFAGNQLKIDTVKYQFDAVYYLPVIHN
jgi:hypothetical protein